jgi:CubicO group peptidase (beta-lactamase class C family)
MRHTAPGQVRIEGTVAPGFESVKHLYEHNMRTLAERETQLCVYLGEEKVVDLWASASGDGEFSPDSLVNVFSSGKSLEAIAIAALVGKGLIDYSARVADYWPEFAANGKGELTVAELMRHEAGLPVFNTSIPPDDLLAANIKLNKVGRVIEGHAQTYRPGDGQRREYHAVTRGWIVNELFRRVDPAGRTIGEFLREDISIPLDVDANIGVRREDLHRVKKVVPLPFGFQLLESLKPKFLKRRMELNFFQLVGKILRLLPLIRNSTARRAPAPFKGMRRIGFFNEPAVAMGETPSANANCSARALAKIAAMMAAGGKWAGTEYIADSGWRAMHAAPQEADMSFLTTTFTQGGVALFAAPAPHSSHLTRGLNVGREGFYGWMGLGGSIFQWHPQFSIGFGYVPTSLNILDLVNERGKAYQAEVLRCVEKLRVSAVGERAVTSQLASPLQQSTG